MRHIFSFLNELPNMLAALALVKQCFFEWNEFITPLFSPSPIATQTKYVWKQRAPRDSWRRSWHAINTSSSCSSETYYGRERDAEKIQRSQLIRPWHCAYCALAAKTCGEDECGKIQIYLKIFHEWKSYKVEQKIRNFCIYCIYCFLFVNLHGHPTSLIQNPKTVFYKREKFNNMTDVGGHGENQRTIADHLDVKR